MSNRTVTTASFAFAVGDNLTLRGEVRAVDDGRQKPITTILVWSTASARCRGPHRTTPSASSKGPTTPSAPSIPSPDPRPIWTRPCG